MKILKRSIVIAAITTSALTTPLLTGCTAHQQDALFAKVTKIGRDKAGLEKHQTQTIDIEMTYLERKGSGPVVMLVHGFSANKDTWLRFADHLPDDYHIIAPDLAGHGDSPTAESYDLELQTERLHALAATLGIDSFHIVGNSMGGAISTIYATKYSQQLASLTLIDAAGMDGANKSEYFTMLEQGTNPLIATDKDSFEFRMDMVMAKPPMLPWPLRPALVRDTVARAELNYEIFDDMIATRERMSGDDYKQLVDTTVDMPTLIMWGEKDRVLDVSAVKTFKNYIPQAKVEIFEGVGHVPMLEIPKESAHTLTAFISSLELKQQP